MVSTDIPLLIHPGDNPPAEPSMGSDHDLVTPTAAERDAVARVAQLFRPADRSIKLAAGGYAIELPPSLPRAPRRSAENLADNNTITLTRMSKQVTVEQTAGPLNVPISFVEHLLNPGEVSFEHVDHQRLIQRDDVLAIRAVYAAKPSGPRFVTLMRHRLAADSRWPLSRWPLGVGSLSCRIRSSAATVSSQSRPLQLPIAPNVAGAGGPCLGRVSKRASNLPPIFLEDEANQGLVDRGVLLRTTLGLMTPPGCHKQRNRHLPRGKHIEAPMAAPCETRREGKGCSPARQETASAGQESESV